jgi:hypothetical protein
VVSHIPGEPGYSPHWGANLVQTAPGIIVEVIAASRFASDHFPEALFDDVEDILAAEEAGLVTIEELGPVLCPIVAEPAAEAPGNNDASEEFSRPWPLTF